jgi:hypothetical protein
MKKIPRLPAKRENELLPIAVLKSPAGKFQQQLLEGLLRVRRRDRQGVSGDGRQPHLPQLAKQLKTIGLHLKRTLDSQIESRE